MMRRAAHRAADRDGWFLATQLLTYQRRHNLTDAALAASLGITETTLWRLCLCRLPVGAEDWRQGWPLIVTAFECDPDALRRVLEEE